MQFLSVFIYLKPVPDFLFTLNQFLSFFNDLYPVPEHS